MSFLDRKQKRQCFPVEGTDPKIHIRGMKNSELDRSEKLTDTSEKNGYLLGVILCEDDGRPVFTQPAGETDAEFSARVRASLDAIDWDLVTQNLVFEALGKIAAYKLDDVKKNSLTITKPDSPDVLDSSISAGGTGGT